MVRRIASQVHQQVSRLMLANFIKREPVWYQAVLSYPPLPLPPKAPPSRTPYDKIIPRSSAETEVGAKPPSAHPEPVYYIEDEIRRQFFRDHPFEAFRPTTLIEGAGIADPHPIRELGWTRLRQRGRNPTPEDAIQYALTLYQYHQTPLTQAYASAVAQFRSLRSEHHIATTFAVLEAEELGAVFVPGEIGHAFEKEKKSLRTWERREELDEGAIAARKRWKAIVQKAEGVDQWSKGQEYVRLWKSGHRPSYSPELTKPIVGQPVEEVVQKATFLGVAKPRS